MIDLQVPVPVQVPDAEYNRLLGFPVHRQLEGRARELADSVRAWYAEHGNPWVFAGESLPAQASEDAVSIGGQQFRSVALSRLFSQTEADAGVLVAVSAGPECEARAHECWLEEKPDEYFFTEVYGSAVVEHLVTAVGAQLCAWAEARGLAVLPHYSPGYTGWDISDQVPFRALFPSSLPGPLGILPSGMPQPKKSLLAVFGLTRRRDRVQGSLVACERCAFEGCQYRRAPYVYAPGVDTPAPAAAPVKPGAAYRTNTRALRKWASERLELKFQPDGTVRARFRYEGTTCSNMGHPLAFDYFVELAPPSTGYRIERAECRPATDDRGHTRMCAYLDQGSPLLEVIRHEHFLLGQPLDAVLSWERDHSPAGCYCGKTARAHKWGLVLETIHYTLAQPKTHPKT